MSLKANWKENWKNKGRFFWLLFLEIILSNFIASMLASGKVFTRLAITLTISILLIMPGYYLYARSIKADKQSAGEKPSPALRRSWPTSAILLAILVIAKAVVCILLFVFLFYPCSSFDVIRNLNGCEATLPHPFSVLSISFSHDGALMATSELYGPVRLWSYPNPELLLTIEIDRDHQTTVALSPDGSLVATGSYGGPIRVWEAATGDVLHTLVQENDSAGQVAFSPDNARLVSIADSGLQIWNARSGELENTLEQDSPSDFAISPDGNLIASANRSGYIRLWRLSDGVNVFIIRQPYLETLIFSPDSKYLVTVGSSPNFAEDRIGIWDTAINFWDTSDGLLDQTVPRQNAHITSISISRDGAILAGGEQACFGEDKSLFGRQCVHVWQLTEGNRYSALYVPYGAAATAFAPIDDNLLIGSFSGVFIWRLP